jgi:hypothetical protein
MFLLFELEEAKEAKVFLTCVYDTPPEGSVTGSSDCGREMGKKREETGRVE